MSKNFLTTVNATLFFCFIFIQNYTLNLGVINVGLIIFPIIFSIIIIIYNKAIVKYNDSTNFPIFIFLLYFFVRGIFSTDLKEAFIYYSYILLCIVIMYLTYVYSNYILKYEKVISVIIIVNILHIFSIAVYFYLSLTLSPEEISLLFTAFREAGARTNREITSFVTSESGTIRFNGYYFDPNYWAMYATMSLTIISNYAIIYFKFNKSKSFYILLILIPSFLSILITFSRGALLSIGLSSLILIFLLRISRNPFYRTYLVYFIIVLIIVFFIFLSFFSEIINSFAYKFSNDNEALENTRSNIWSLYFNHIKNERIDQLIFGYGLKRDPSVDYINMSTHNIILYLVIKEGILGLFSYCLIIFVFVKDNVLKFGTNILQIISVLGFLSIIIQSLFLDPLYHLPFWVLIAFNSSIKKFLNNEKLSRTKLLG